MSLADALARLYARIPLGMRLGLDAMRDACACHGHPERSFRAIHVAGTNGKGSVSAMVEAIARAQGLRTGLYTSPHLCRFAERIRIDGDPLEDGALAALLDRALDTAPELSFFETATLAAFLAFREAEVDLAVVEVGIGGRLDATNVIPPPVAAAITRIALDHVDRLGPTLVDIAREKAAIAKPGVSIVLGPMPAEIRAAIDEVAFAHGAVTRALDGVEAPAKIGLAGAHQEDNARIAVALAEHIGVSREAIARGLASVTWPGRLERIGPYLLDAAHNPDGAEALAAYVRSLGVLPADTALVFGALEDKDWAAMLRTLAPLADRRVFVGDETGETAGASPAARARALVDPERMRSIEGGEVASTVPLALAAAARPLVVVAGSFALVGSARASLCRLPRDPPVAL